MIGRKEEQAEKKSLKLQKSQTAAV